MKSYTWPIVAIVLGAWCLWDAAHGRRPMWNGVFAGWLLCAALHRVTEATARP